MTTLHRVGLPFTVAAVALVLSLLAVAAHDRLWRAERQIQLHAATLQAANALQQQLKRNLSAARLLGSRLRQYDGQLEPFEPHARELLGQFDGVTNLQLAPAGIISQIYPLGRHQAALGHNILRDDHSRNEAWIAVNSRELILSGPFELVQGGQGLLARQPVFLPAADGERFWGFASALILLEQLIIHSPLAELPQAGLAYQLTRRDPDSGATRVIAASEGFDAALASSASVALPNQLWTLKLAWRQPPLLAPNTLLEVAIGVLVALLAAAACAFGLPRSAALTRSLRAQSSRSAQLRQALAHERDRARDYLDNLSQTLLLVTDRRGRVILLNRFGYQLLGHPPDSLAGNAWIDCCVPPEWANRASALFRALGRKPLGYQTQGEIPLRCSDGSRRVLSWRCTRVKGHDAQPNLLFIGEDTTEQRRTEHHLMKLSQAVEQSASGVVMLRRSGYIEYVNPAFTRLTGFSAAEAVGRKPRFLECAESDRQALQALRREVVRGRVWRGELCYQRKNGTPFWAHECVSPISNEAGEVTHFVSVLEDISSQHAHQQEIEQLAYYDQLTGVGNRRQLLRRLDALLNAPSAAPVALLHFDLDQFKRVNELLGHDAGDQLLVRVAQKLQQAVGALGEVARISGDEFIIALCNTDQAGAERVAQRLLRELRQPRWLDSELVRSHEMLISASVGIAVSPDRLVDASVLLRHADLAMNHAKKRGGQQLQLFTPSMAETVQANLRLEKELHRAIRQHEFVLYFQPQLDLERGRVCGVEALIRWQHPGRGLIYPDQFIPLAEEAGLIVAIGQQVIRQACAAWGRLERQGLGQLHVAVNLSALQFLDPLFISTFQQILGETRTPAARIELELTESTLMSNIDEAIDLLRQLKALGCSLAIDDFGTGYSSLNYLKQLPVDLLKIDRSFIRDIPTDRNDKAITAAVIAMARELNLQVVAEGVEEHAQHAFLQRNACQITQGYLYSPPVAEADLAATIAAIEQRRFGSAQPVAPARRVGRA